MRAVDPAGELGGGKRRDDAAGVDQVVRRRELLDAVEEERPLLGKEQRLPRIELNCPASDSTCEKSGLTVPLIVRFGVMPQRTFMPNSGRDPS